MTRRKISRVTLEGMRRTLTNDEVNDNHEFDYAADYCYLISLHTIPLPFCRLRDCMFYFFKFGQVGVDIC